MPLSVLNSHEKIHILLNISIWGHTVKKKKTFSVHCSLCFKKLKFECKKMLYLYFICNN